MEEMERSSDGRQEARDSASNRKLGLHFWIMKRSQSKMGEAAVGDGFSMNNSNFDQF
jgi:uncharacterized membrane-anchored protein